MKWHRGVLVAGPLAGSRWARDAALQPTPYLIARRGVIRIFAGFRDEAGVSRVGYVDVAADDPTQVIDVSDAAVLDVGRRGTFDQDGVVPCAAVERSGTLYLFYAGYQHGTQIRSCAFAGLAVSTDGGESFTRFSEAPIADRQDGELVFRVIHTMMLDNGGWRVWYGGGDTIDTEGARRCPRYDIRHAFSPDGIHLDASSARVCLGAREREAHVGHPCVLRQGGLYRMFFAAAGKTGGSRLAYAESDDGLVWVRKDGDLGFDPSGAHWDIGMQGYPSVVSHAGRTYLFYNGSDYGTAGFGCAELARW